MSQDLVILLDEFELLEQIVQTGRWPSEVELGDRLRIAYLVNCELVIVKDGFAFPTIKGEIATTAPRRLVLKAAVVIPAKAFEDLR